MRLEGKVVFLTGAGAGIAKATARLCAREGAKVAICELNREAGERAEREIRAAGGDALFVHCDVTQDDSVREAIALEAAANIVDVLQGRRPRGAVNEPRLAATA